MSSSWKVVQATDARRWDDFVCERGGHLLQSSAWGDLKARFGWGVQRLLLERDGTPLGGAQMLFRSFPLGLKLAYVPRGPVVDPADPQACALLLDTLCGAARSHGAFTLKVEPNWLDDASLSAWLGSRRFQPGSSIQPRTTIHLDLTQPLDAILAQMKPKWRYNIRLAERKGVMVREGGAADLSSFYQLLEATSARDAFRIHSPEYYRTALELMAPAHAQLFVAEYQEQPLAAIFVTAFGREAIYLYGASGNAHRDKMPNHALHWAAIRWAKARGCTCYDLWGVADVADAVGATSAMQKVAPDKGPADGKAGESSPLPHGLYQFKQGFGGTLVQYIGGFDAVFSRARFVVYERALSFRRGLT